MTKAFRRFRVVPSEEGQTLTVLVARRLKGTSRERATAIIRAGGVYVNKLRIRVPSVSVVAGERVTVYPGAADAEPLDADALVFAYRDPNFVVLDKPRGVPVAQTRDTARGTLSEALRRRLEQEGFRRAYVGLVHRIDREASGLVLFTIRDVANRSVHKQFVDHSIDRRYRTLVTGAPPDRWTVDAPLRVAGTRVRVAEVEDGGADSARTEFVRLASLDTDTSSPRALVEATLTTGRMHQIRVHAAHSGHPLVGDDRYGTPDPGGLHLHAHRLELTHPLTGEALRIESALPPWARVAADDDGVTRDG
jgi:23S rRNA pseudouridine1911/1915/1917 synthase